ncbi:MAG: MATE family efflux transporter [Actinobacteria bacterium]|nr:MATE family efflux transporter [Actinomycetota bacterium]
MKSIIASFRKHKEFVPKLIAIASPIILQNFFTSTLNFVDVFMVSQLGEKEIAGVGIASQIYFLFIMFVFSIGTGAAIFTAQYWGKKDIKSIRSNLGIGITFALIFSAIYTLVTFLFPDTLIRLFNNDPQVIELGVQYIRIIAFSLIMTSISIVYATILRSTEQVRFPMVASFIGLVANTLLNYLLIFGKLGFPELGVRGAAIATVISRGIEFSIILGFTYIRKYPIAARLKEIFNYSKEMIRNYTRIWLPVMGQSVGWVLGYLMYGVIYGHISTGAFAAYNIACSIEKIGLMLFSGLGSACAIMVGNRIGAGEEYKARDYSKNFLFLSASFSIIIAVVLIIVRGYIVNFYNLTEQSNRYLYYILLVMALIMLAKATNIIFQMGILKAGGDTLFGMIIELGGIWVVGVPLAALAAFIFKLPVYYVMAIAATEELVKMIAGFYRFLSNKWIHNLTRQAT